ncbi:hypothetical protein AALP_AA7G229500 [Arabis alpina]|uniref:non-specific serine/threonine protein kinase n=1 Tax=Arabis alpina TaxID=50452 RepID=A0A087GJY6_ARAAL|nr:hypothetical protein AALP_AA7G229500 [Arabis alpina]
MSCSSSSGSEGEEEGFDAYRKGGYHAVRIGDPFSGGRYIAQRKLGWGQFSTVWLAFDTLTSSYVALKIQKSAQQFAQAALHEIEFLSAAADGDVENTKCVVRLIDHFKHTGPNGQHLCMVLEFLGDSLLRLIRYNRYKGLKLDKVREICRCILTGLDYLHRELGMIHSDLKPENILLCSTIDSAKDPVRSGVTPVLEKPEGNANGGASTMNMIEKKLKRRAKRAVAKISERRGSMVGTLGEEGSSKTERCLDGIDMRCKVVDFGNACWADKQFAEEIQTRQYRAPEVILKSGYSFSVDMWSFGCTAFELVTGDMLFAPRGCIDYEEDEDHLAMMMELLGKMPRKIAIGGGKSKEFFDRHGDLKRIRRLKFRELEQILIDKSKLTEAEAKEFAEFLRPILEFAPDKRPTAQQCLEHPWMNVKTQNNEDHVEAQMNNLHMKG